MHICTRHLPSNVILDKNLRRFVKALMHCVLKELRRELEADDGDAPAHCGTSSTRKANNTGFQTTQYAPKLLKPSVTPPSASGSAAVASTRHPAPDLAGKVACMHVDACSHKSRRAPEATSTSDDRIGGFSEIDALICRCCVPVMETWLLLSWMLKNQKSSKKKSKKEAKKRKIPRSFLAKSRATVIRAA
jgi:hypothetical protein